MNSARENSGDNRLLNIDTRVVCKPYNQGQNESIIPPIHQWITGRPRLDRMQRLCPRWKLKGKLTREYAFHEDILEFSNALAPLTNRKLLDDSPPSLVL